MYNSKLSLFRLAAFIFWIMAPLPVLFAQPAPVPSHTVPVALNSGIHDGRGASSDAEIVWQEVIRIADAPWLRLRFGKVNLGSESYLRITSLHDGSSQRLNAISLSRWNNTSAYFNGDAVEVRLFVAPRDAGVYVEIVEVIVGEYLNGGGIESICGPTDDRTASSDPAVGRMLSSELSIGCSGWIVFNGLHVTAGHCVTGGTADVLQFNVPASLSDGTLQHPPAEDQYSTDQQSVTYKDGGIGNDWAVFEVFDNSNTGFATHRSPGSIIYRGSGFESCHPSSDRLWYR